MGQPVYEFTALRSDGEELCLDVFQGKVLLVVNTASHCGLTPQYEGLQMLYEKYQGSLEILGFPCNQFGAQESGSNEDIRGFCDLTYGVTFPLFAKIEVNGKDTHPLFAYLKKELPGLLHTQRIKWNFTKFLLDGNGRPVRRFAPKITPAMIEKSIQSLIL